jgi:hypothetical protein
MPLNLDTEIVATSYDPSTDSCAYTIERNGKRWTVQVPLAQLDACGANKQARRDYLGNVLLAAMDGPPDGATPDTAVPLDLDLRSVTVGHASRRTATRKG